MVRRLTLVAAIALVGTLVGAPGAGAVRTRTVVLEDIAFRPGTVSIERGSRVRWVWRDAPTPHDIRSRGSRRFRGARAKTTGTHVVTFRTAGTHRYVCSIHIGMQGIVRVR